MNDQHQPLTSATIMMVDDEPITMQTVQAYLQEDGYSRFIMEGSSTQVLEILEQHRPDLVFLNLVLSGKSALGVLAKIREHPEFRHLPIIILTSSTDTRSKLKALSLGATDFLSKPVDPSELRLRVRNTLAAKSYLDQITYYDPLTRLPNKRMFQEHLDRATILAKRHEKPLALLNIAVDNFGGINAAMGQEAADEILRQATLRIENTVRHTDILASASDLNAARFHFYRGDGNNFCLVLDDITREQDAAVVATRILDAFSDPLVSDSSEVYATLSIGIATCPSSGVNSSTLTRLAASAMEYVSKQGGNAFQFSSRSINSMYERKMCLEAMLRKALEKEEFVLHYQPKVHVATGQIRGVEALLRWDNGENGILPPINFIPLAEETGLIIPIGEWVLGTACQQLAEWNRKTALPISMNINLSAIQFRDKAFLDKIERAVASSRVAAPFVTLELTESFLMDDIEEKIRLIREIRDMGINLSIDDFGTGYSALSYLSRLPVNELKIDRSFIMNTPQMSDSSAIVEAIIFLARKLRLRTIAEGVESPQQLQFLQRAGCDEYQGFLFSRPLPAKNLYEIFLQKSDRPKAVSTSCIKAVG